MEGAQSGPSKEVSKQPAECHRILNIITLLLWNFSGDAKVKNTIVGTTYPQNLKYGDHLNKIRRGPSLSQCCQN